jgi:hypothetical protein
LRPSSLLRRAINPLTSMRIYVMVISLFLEDAEGIEPSHNRFAACRVHTSPRIPELMERATGFEPAPDRFRADYSTIELHTHNAEFSAFGRYTP